MSDAYENLDALILEQRRLKNAVLKNAELMTLLISGDLRNLSAYPLRKLKKELKNYNIHTGRWK